MDIENAVCIILKLKIFPVILNALQSPGDRARLGVTDFWHKEEVDRPRGENSAGWNSHRPLKP
jgi:hypothetical protein